MLGLGMLLFSALTAAARFSGIPTAPLASGNGELRLSDLHAIVIDNQFADAVDKNGDTLIPPSLQDFMATFVNDLKVVNVNLGYERGSDIRNGTIFVTLGDPSDYRDVAGRRSSEGYALSISTNTIKIVGASPLGAWWATRTLLQAAIMGNGSIPRGSVIDTPGWRTRGMMLDAGRHYYPPEFLIEMCAYMSFFKQNTFHLHLSDNLYNNRAVYDRKQSLSLYARFRLWSDSPAVSGLNLYRNESYSKDQFDQIQSACAARGVTILPEIEAPGHALVFVQWKPELGLDTDLSLLNISNPATIPTMKTVWSTFLPWFHSKIVHIGADEYTGDVHDYNTFVNAMADHIYTTANKTTRIWGTFPPVYKPGYANIYRNVSVQHWEFFEDNPLKDYILNNHSVLNSDDTFYVVNKLSASYPQAVNINATFTGNPATGGGLWYPNVFDIHKSSNNPPRNESLVIGSVAPLWNDYGANATVYSEAFYAWKEGIPALADKQWGGNLTFAEFTKALKGLQASIPGQNLERRIPSNTSTILSYSFNGSHIEGATVVDSSGNGYHGSTSNCTLAEDGAVVIDACSIRTPLASKGRDYTLTLSLLVSSIKNPANATLLSGPDSVLMLTPKITFFAGGNYYRLNTSLPLNRRLDLSIIGRGSRTFAKIDNGAEKEFLTQLGINGERMEWARMAFECPMGQIGGENAGWGGKVFGVKLLAVA